MSSVAFGWNALHVSVSLCDLTCCLKPVFLLILCLGDLHAGRSGVLKFSTIIALLSVSPIRSL